MRRLLRPGERGRGRLLWTTVITLAVFVSAAATYIALVVSGR